MKVRKTDEKMLAGHVYKEDTMIACIISKVILVNYFCLAPPEIYHSKPASSLFLRNPVIAHVACCCYHCHRHGRFSV